MLRRAVVSVTVILVFYPLSANGSARISPVSTQSPIGSIRSVRHKIENGARIVILG